MNILITGGAGYIGSALTHTLIQQKHHVIVVDNLTSSSQIHLPHAANFHELDIRNTAALSRVAAPNSLDAVIHLAALSNPYESLEAIEEFRSVNVEGTRSVLQVCKANKIKHLVFASSASVYGNLGSQDLQRCAPVSPYGETKLQAEKDILASSVHSKILRLFNVAGASPRLNLGQSRKSPFHLVDLCAQTALGLRPHLAVFGSEFDSSDGTAVRDYIHLEDVVQFFLRSLNSLKMGGHSEILNCGSGVGSSVLDVVHTMEKVSGQKIRIQKQEKRTSDPGKIIAMDPKYECQMSDLKTICETSFQWEKDKLNNRTSAKFVNS